MGFQLLLIMLVTAGVVLTHYADKLPRCIYPCIWREQLPIVQELTGLWILNTPSVGFYTNLSRPIGDQTTTAECIMRQGPFFLLRMYGKFVCFKTLTISDTDWYFFVSKESDTLSFCELCDGSKFAGPIYVSDQASSFDRTRPIGCNLPSRCPKTNDQQVHCSDSEPFDDGRYCKKQRSNRRYKYNRLQRYGKPRQFGYFGYRKGGA